MILGLTDEVLRGFDENLTLMIVLDLSAAFDTLDPEKYSSNIAYRYRH